MRQKCRAIAFQLVAALLWLYAFQPGGSVQVRGLQAVRPPRSARLECAVTTRQVPSDQPLSNLLTSHLQICRAPVCRELRENVGGGRHDCHMSSSQGISADTRPALGPWFLTEAPLVDVNPQADLR